MTTKYTRKQEPSPELVKQKPALNKDELLERLRRRQQKDLVLNEVLKEIDDINNILESIRFYKNEEKDLKKRLKALLSIKDKLQVNKPGLITPAATVQEEEEIIDMEEFKFNG